MSFAQRARHPSTSESLTTRYLCCAVRLECFDAQWTFTAFVAAVMLVVYTLGLPLGIALWLRSRRHELDDPSVRSTMGFLYEVYGTKSGQYLWEVVELLRKLTLTSLVLFFNAGSPFQITFALVVCTYAHVAHGMYRPFVERSSYLLQHFSLGTTTFVFVMGLLFKVEGFGDDSAGDADASDGSGSGALEPDDEQTDILEGLGALLVVVCVLFLLAAVGVGVSQMRKALRGVKLAGPAGRAARRAGAALSGRRDSVAARLRSLSSKLATPGRLLSPRSPRAGGAEATVGDVEGAAVEMMVNPMRHQGDGAGGDAAADTGTARGQTQAHAPARAPAAAPNAGRSGAAVRAGRSGRAARVLAARRVSTAAIQAASAHDDA